MVGVKDEASVNPEKSARHQDTRRQMEVLPARNCMSHVHIITLCNAVKGRHEIPKGFPESCRIAHKIVE